MVRAEFLTLLVGAILLCLINGCSGPTRAYSGSARAADETALLRPQGVTMRKVNGVELSSTSSGATVLPGSNTVELTVDQSNFNAPDRAPTLYTLQLNAQSGVTYAITGARGDGRLCAFPLFPESGLPNFSSPAGCAVRSDSLAPE